MAEEENKNNIDLENLESNDIDSLISDASDSLDDLDNLLGDEDDEVADNTKTDSEMNVKADAINADVLDGSVKGSDKVDETLDGLEKELDGLTSELDKNGAAEQDNVAEEPKDSEPLEKSRTDGVLDNLAKELEELSNDSNDQPTTEQTQPSDDNPQTADDSTTKPAAENADNMLEQFGQTASQEEPVETEQVAVPAAEESVEQPAEQVTEQAAENSSEVTSQEVIEDVIDEVAQDKTKDTVEQEPDSTQDSVEPETAGEQTSQDEQMVMDELEKIAQKQSDPEPQDQSNADENAYTQLNRPQRTVIRSLEKANKPFDFVPETSKDIIGIVAVVTLIVSTIAAALLLLY